MSINSMNSRFAMAEKMSIPQLQQSIQAGSLPAYVGVPLIEQRMQEQKKAAAMAQLAQAQQQAQQFGVPTEKPIAQGIMEQASGIEAMPSNLPVAGYNDGGIVAFADGGEADDFDYEEYQDEQEQAEYENLLNAYMAEAEAAGLEGIPVHQTKKVEVGVEKKADGGIIGLNGGGVPRYQEQGLVEEPSGNPVRNFFNERIVNPTLSGIRRLQERNERMRNADPDSPEGRALAEYAPRELDILESLRPPVNREYSIPIEEQARNLGARVSDLTRGNESNIDPIARAYVDRGMFSNLPPEVPEAAPTAPAEVAPEALGSEFGIQGILTGQKPPAGGGVAPTGGGGERAGGGGATPVGGATTPRERPKSAFEEFINSIKEERASLAKQKQEDKYMALLSAGLGMMSGTSPNAFANIGQGAQAGISQYATLAKQRAAEKAALNKNLLMGQRYQSMEDIAARTADIQEARYREAAAARALAAGSSNKAEDQMRRRLSDIGSLYERRQKMLSDRVAKINPYLDKAGYEKAQADLANDPKLKQYSGIIDQLTEQMYGISSEPQQASSASGNVIQYDSKGNRIK